MMIRIVVVLGLIGFCSFFSFSLGFNVGTVETQETIGPAFFKCVEMLK